MNRKLNVLICSSIFPNNKEVTKGIYIYHQANALSKHCNVKVVAPVPYFPGWIRSKIYDIYPQISSKESIGGMEVLHPRVFITPKIGRSLYGFLYALSLYKVFKRLKRSFHPDIIISYWVYPDGFASVLLAKLLRVPVILGGRGCDVNNADEYISKKLMVSWALRVSDRVMSVSKAMKEKMKDLGVPERKINVIPNGLNDLFKPIDQVEARRTAGIDSRAGKRKLILFCGRFSYEKGVENLINAVKILNEDDILFDLLLVGEGPDKSKIRDLVKSYGLENRVSFKDEVEHEDVPVLMNSADIFCLPSLSEGCPNVVIESLACGLPVVAMRVGGVPEILTSPEYGIMVQEQNVLELSEALKKALQRTWEREKIATANIRTWDDVSSEILEDIHLVLNP